MSFAEAFASTGAERRPLREHRIGAKTKAQHKIGGRFYDVLLRVEPSPVVALNRAVAIAMRDGPEVGLAMLETVLEQGGLDGYSLAHAARADLLRRLGRGSDARKSYARALELTRQPAERRFLEARSRALVSLRS